MLSDSENRMKTIVALILKDLIPFCSNYLDCRNLSKLCLTKAISTWLDYINRKRVDESKWLNDLGILNTNVISLNLGFSSHQYFSTVLNLVTGDSPIEFIRKAS
ncbi:MAG: hypothetical protein CML14_00295 [Puniceicoccaceae bacterium]|nr:hypothetical protein [Puniceicoccaceae bacterium]